MTSQETVDFVKERLKDPAKVEKPSLICEEVRFYHLFSNTQEDNK